MTHCVKTGARVWVQELGAVYAADIYAVGSSHLVVKFNNEYPENTNVWDPDEAMDLGATHFAMRANFPKGDWLREDLGVLMLARSHLSGDICDE
jgi:hypothetical protein